MRSLLLILGPVLASFGVAVLVSLAVAALTGAWREHTDASRILAAEVADSLTAAGKHGQLAEGVIGMPAPKLSAALNVGEPLNMWRLAPLPPAFWLALIQRIAARYGAIVILPHQVDVLKGAANTSPKTMAKMGLFSSSERQSA